MLAGWLNSARFISNHNVGNNVYSRIFIQTRDYAARKGTREKARQKKIKMNLEKIGHEARKKSMLQKKKATQSPLLLIDDSSLKPIMDDVWIIKNHPQPVYSLQEAIEYHRETHHPTMFNVPNALVNAFIECNMKHQNKNKYVDKFSKNIDMPHVFDTGKKKLTVLALAKNSKQQDNAVKAGAEYVGGTEVIKQIQGGKFDIKEYDTVIAHIDILTELLLIRGLLKRKFPSVKAGTLSNDIGSLITKMKNSIRYYTEVNEEHKDYAKINLPFGKLDMDIAHLEENFATVVKDIESVGASRTGSFIKRIQISSEPSEELFKVDYSKFLPKKAGEDTEQEPDDSAVIESV
ncbi:mitochondrial ribosomal protein L1 [Megachile rotundata]|uniref:mitochondrial ribosomal protein L1 n=1 Tax=Megachile rotundata TaxID=143995 RepID=UPI000614CA03|nr:PREDICTED: uncharacterized protein LOC100878075 [Megachile rotundata]